jgi:hypothetical protein
MQRSLAWKTYQFSFKHFLNSLLSWSCISAPQKGQKETTARVLEGKITCSNPCVTSHQVHNLVPVSHRRIVCCNRHALAYMYSVSIWTLKWACEYDRFGLKGNLAFLPGCTPNQVRWGRWPGLVRYMLVGSSHEKRNGEKERRGMVLVTGSCLGDSWVFSMDWLTLAPCLSKTCVLTCCSISLVWFSQHHHNTGG